MFSYSQPEYDDGNQNRADRTSFHNAAEAAPEPAVGNAEYLSKNSILFKALSDGKSDKNAATATDVSPDSNNNEDIDKLIANEEALDNEEQDSRSSEDSVVQYDEETLDSRRFVCFHLL